MNNTEFAARVYGRGFIPADFDAGSLLPGLVIVSGVQRPGVTETGMPIPETKISGQFCLFHRVVAVSPFPNPFCLRPVLSVQPGDLVKCYEAHLDILDPSTNLLSIPAEYIKAIISRGSVHRLVSLPSLKIARSSESGPESAAA